MAREFSLSKTEKLKSRKLVDALFARGKSLSVFPLRVSYVLLPAEEEEEESCLQIGVTASKRNFKRAVHRNRIKRLLREAYRLQKTELQEVLKAKKLKGYVFFIYVDKTLPVFATVYDTMAKCLTLLQKRALSINEEPS